MDDKRRRPMQVKLGRRCHDIGILFAGVVVLPGLLGLALRDNSDALRAFAMLSAVIYAIGWGLRYTLAGETLKGGRQ